MTIAYQTREFEDGPTAATAQHKGYDIEVRAGYDITSDGYRFHVYVDKGGMKKIDIPPVSKNTLKDALDAGVDEAVNWINQQA